MIVVWLAFLFIVTITVMAVSARKKIREKDVDLNISATALDEALLRQAKDADTIIELRAEIERYKPFSDERSSNSFTSPVPVGTKMTTRASFGPIAAPHVKKPRKKG